VVVRVGSIEGKRRLAGLAVSKAVGRAVVRNTIKRRLRAILADILPQLPPGTGVVVRALPPAAQVSFEVLEGDVKEAMAAAVRKRSP
jgi:ribonuclease P protein component